MLDVIDYMISKLADENAFLKQELEKMKEELKSGEMV
jgi:cell division septum initiation protein DivIVA